jgi:hypothetical protein
MIVPSTKLVARVLTSHDPIAEVFHDAEMTSSLFNFHSQKHDQGFVERAHVGCEKELSDMIDTASRSRSGEVSKQAS